MLCVTLPVGSLSAQHPDSVSNQDSLNYSWERFSVNLGFFLTSIYSDISLNGSQAPVGLNLSLEDALGLSPSTFVIRGEASYNFGKESLSHVRLGYFGLIRSSKKILENEIEIGDEVYPIGTEISTRYDLHIIRSLYDYAYYQDDRVSLGVSAGLYVLPVDFSIGTGNIIDERAKFIAPLPVVGIRNMVFFTPKILLKQNLEVLYLKTSYFKGYISDINVYVEYNPFKHLGFGLGFNTFSFHFSTLKELENFFEFNGTIETGFTGILFYARYFF